MAITDYASLRTAIADFSHRDDLTAYLDTFIALAEERLAKDLRVPEIEASATGTLSGITLALPSDFSVLRRLTIETTTKYQPINVGADGLRRKYDSANGVPGYFSIVGSNIEFNRTPDSGYAYTLDYYKRPTAITSTNTTSTLLTNRPAVYLYACLLETAWFTKSDGDISRYQNKYLELLGLANRTRQGGPMQIVTA